MAYRPLADELRPESLDDVVGQQELIGPNGVLRRVIESGNVPNMIFYGPSGIGKTTVANIIAKRTNRPMYRLNATTASISDIKDIIADIGTMMAPEGVLLYLDEIQYFNKKQQQSLLEFMENGKITLIASTTENPYFYVFNAVLSRATVFEFKPLSQQDIIGALERGSKIMEERLNAPILWENGVKDHLASACGGDMRKAMNALELLISGSRHGENGITITLADAKTVSQRSSVRFDKDGDNHYDILSAFQKSIRGSDPDAAVHYLAVLLEAGDMISACRRLMVIAAEDIGLAYPQAISIVKSCVDCANMLGMPEARIPLADAAILLATAPKSNSGICAIDAALSDIRRGKGLQVPSNLQDSHYSGSQKLGHGIGYVYPHSYPGHYYPQQYLPDDIKGAHYYEFGDNKTEMAASRYWDEIKKR